MASLMQIANELAKNYIRAKHKKYALNEMIFEINYLSSPKTNDSLDFKTKAQLYDLIHDFLSGNRDVQLCDDEEIQPVYKDITLFFEKKHFILKQLRTSNSIKIKLN